VVDIHRLRLPRLAVRSTGSLAGRSLTPDKYPTDGACPKAATLVEASLQNLAAVATFWPGATKPRLRRRSGYEISLV
jgi:hypothetical protein